MRKKIPTDTVEMNFTSPRVCRVVKIEDSIYDGTADHQSLREFHMTGDKDEIAKEVAFTLGWEKFKVGTTTYSVFGKNLDTGERSFELWWHSEFEQNFTEYMEQTTSNEV